MQDQITKALGLVNQFSPLSTQPGSLVRGNDIINQRENVYEDRRGYKVDATLADDIKNVLAYSGKVLAHNGTTMSYGKSTYADYSGSYTEPTDQRIRAAEAASNLYFTTNLGVKVFTDVTGTAARSAGVPRCLDPSYALNAAGTGFLANNFQCAYRCVIQKTDANQNVITGYPSQRLWVINAAGTAKNIDLTVYIPSEAIAGDIIQFFRTAQVSGVAEDTSADEMALVYQTAITSTNITNGYVTFTDSITDALRGASLYTSPSQEGIAQANERPPLCNDLALFRSNFMFYANTKTRQRLFVTLVSASALSGKTITLGGVTYNFGASEIISGGGSPQVLVSATGVVAVDIDLTARSLVRVINRYAGNTTVYAYYQSGPDDLPGQLVIEEKGVGAAAFTLQASDSAISAMFYPAPPVSPSTNTLSTSSNSIQKNALYYSKFQQNEHVPLVNYLPVGPSNKNILRIVALRESLIIIKEEGVYRLTGETPQSFSVTPLDLKVFCKAPNSVAALANQVFMFSNQGIVSITETEVSIISHEIKQSLKPLLTVSTIADYTTAFAYESDGQYLISTLSDKSDSAANQTLVYNIFTKTWVRWSFAIKAAIVDEATDKLYFAKYEDPKVYIERKSFTNDDYADPEQDIVFTAVAADTVSFTVTSGRAPQVGWVLNQDTTYLAIDTITFLAGGVYQVTLDGDIPASWVAGAALLFPSVGFDLKWSPWTYNQAGLLKQVWMAKFLADTNEDASSVSKLYAVFSSNYDEAEDEIEITQESESWGADAWGGLWGGGTDPFGYPMWLPRNKQYSTRLSIGVKHKKALEKVSICGVALAFRLCSDRIGR